MAAKVVKCHTVHGQGPYIVLEKMSNIFSNINWQKIVFKKMKYFLKAEIDFSLRLRSCAKKATPQCSFWPREHSFSILNDVNFSGLFSPNMN